MRRLSWLTTWIFPAARSARRGVANASTAPHVGRMDANAQPAQDYPRTEKKPSFPIREELRTYLRRYRRDRELPVTYERMLGFQEGIPLNDDAGKPTLWNTVIYDPQEMRTLNEDLKRIYALLRTD